MIRWLVVGTGQAGKCHIAAIRNEPAAALAGVVSLERPPGFETVYPGIAAAVAETSPDAVVLATPHDTHVALALEAIGLGLPVLCEKPVGRSADEAREVLAAATRASVPVGVVLNQRAVVHHRWVRDLIASGDLEPRSVTFRGNLARLGGWHADPRRVGGGLPRVIGLHYLDLLRWWLGEPATVAAVIGGGESEDTVSVTMTFAGGVTGSLELVAKDAQGSGPVTCSIAAPRSRLELSGPVVTAARGLPEPPAAEPRDDVFLFGPGHQTVISEATVALLAAAELPVPLAAALPSLALVDQVYRCARRK